MNEKHKSDVALIVIDVQQGLFERSTPIYQAEQVLKNINLTIERARQAGVPVIFIQHANENTLIEGSDAWQLHPEIRPHESETLIHKRHGNAFIETGLNAVSAAAGVKTLVINGLVTHGCVRATTLGALEEGYRVILVEDGHSSFSKDAPKLIEKWNRTLHQKGAELMRAEDVDFSAIVDR